MKIATITQTDPKSRNGNKESSSFYGVLRVKRDAITRKGLILNVISNKFITVLKNSKIRGKFRNGLRLAAQNVGLKSHFRIYFIDYLNLLTLKPPNNKLIPTVITTTESG